MSPEPRFRFFAVFFRKSECTLCRAQTSRAKYAMEQHAEWHASRDESQTLDEGTVRGFCDVTVRDGCTTNTGWVSIGGPVP